MVHRQLLSVENLSIGFGVPGRSIPVVSNLSFGVKPGETVALVGESGSGKTLIGKAIMGLLPVGAVVSSGRIVLNTDGAEHDLLGMSPRALRALQGRAVSMIFQEPMSALSPLHTIGRQVAEVLEVHGEHDRAAVRRKVLEIFEEVGFPEPERAWRAYPFELSGGLRQRAVIAMAMIGNPTLLIADEPTTALDVTTQAMVLDLLSRLQRDHGMSVILITHDLGIVANMADRIVVLRRGEIVERGPADVVLLNPGHGYTRALIEAAPKIPHDVTCHVERPLDAIMRVRGLSKTYPGRRHSFRPDEPPTRVLTDVEMAIERGTTTAVVGESGSGKTTVAKLILRVERPDPGAEVLFCPRHGTQRNVAELAGDELKQFRRQAQMVFQDPYGALSPRMSIQDIVTEPLKVHRIGTRSEQRERAAYLMRRVGLSPDHLGRFPHAFSGGQRQRIAIARALALEPEFLVCDEPTSALDVSVQAEVLELLQELGAEMGLSYLFISHDLAVVAQLADRVVVMRRGTVVEEGSADCIFNDARHPYTRALLAASPEADMEHRLDLKVVAAGAGRPESWPEPYRYEGDRLPGLVPVNPGHLVRSAA